MKFNSEELTERITPQNAGRSFLWENFRGIYLPSDGAPGDDKVIATLIGRFDRSSLNGSQDEYYFYPKVSLVVNLLNFDFMDNSIFNPLNPRIS